MEKILNKASMIAQEQIGRLIRINPHIVYNSNTTFTTLVSLTARFSIEVMPRIEIEKAKDEKGKLKLEFVQKGREMLTILQIPNAMEDYQRLLCQNKNITVYFVEKIIAECSKYIREDERYAENKKCYNLLRKLETISNESIIMEGFSIPLK